MGYEAGDHRLQLSLPAETSAVSQARRAVEHVGALSAFPETQFALRVLVSELFANGVKRKGRVYVEIGDCGSGFDRAGVSMPDEDATSGRGLALLDTLADRWGVTRAGEHLVWFELALQ